MKHLMISLVILISFMATMAWGQADEGENQADPGVSQSQDLGAAVTSTMPSSDECVVCKIFADQSERGSNAKLNLPDVGGTGTGTSPNNTSK